MEIFFEYVENIIFLGVCIVIVSGFTGYLFYRRIKEFQNLNPRPKIRYFEPQQYSSKRSPTIPVKTGIYIEDFLEFNLLANKFVIDLRVWFIFNPSLSDLSIIGDFAFDKGTILYKSSPETKMIDGMLFAQYKVRLRFSSDLDFHAFPVDDHRLYITLRNESTSPEETVFDVSETGLGLSEKVFFSEWKIIDLGAEAGFQEEQLHKHIPATYVAFPCATFFLDFSRSGIRKALVIVLPIIFIFFVGFSSMVFVKNNDIPFVIYVNTGCITGLIAYRFVMESISPDVGYLTLTDYIFTLFLTYSFLTFLVASFLMLGGYSKDIVRIVNVFFSLLIPVSMLFFLYEIIIKKGRKKC